MKCPICNKNEIEEYEGWCQECEAAKFLNPSMPFMNDPKWFETFEINELGYQYAVNICVELILGRPRGLQKYFLTEFMKYLAEIVHAGKSVNIPENLQKFLVDNHMEITGFTFMTNLCKELTINVPPDTREMFLQRFIVNTVEVLLRKERNGEIRRGMWDTRKDERTWRKPGNVS